MIGEMKKDWEHFKDSEPGDRFEERYRRRQEDEKGWADPRRLFNVIVGTILVVGSAFFGWAPGPGMLTFFIGLGMIAGEFHPAARLLDWAEVRTRKLVRWSKKVWETSSRPLRALIVAAILICVATLLYVGYRLFGG